MVSLREQLQEMMKLFVQWRSSAFIQTSQSPGFHKHLFCLWKISYTKGEAEAKGLCSCLSLRLLLQSGLFKHDLMQAKDSGNPRDMDEDPSRHHENLVYQCCDYHRSTSTEKWGGNHQFIPFSCWHFKNTSRPRNSTSSATIRNTGESILRLSESWLRAEPSASTVGAVGISVTCLQSFPWLHQLRIQLCLKAVRFKPQRNH